MAIGAIQRRQGKWVESTANLEKAVELDPKNGSFLFNLAYSYMAARNFEAADKTFDRGIEAAPESFGSRALKGELAIRWKGDVSVAEKELASVPPGVDPDGLVTSVRAGVLTLQRKFNDALRVIQQFRGETLTVRAGTFCPTTSFEGTLYLYLGDKVNARSAFERARIIAERLVRESPDDAARHGQLGLILAGLGQKDAAIAEGKRAVELLPESQDAFDGPEVTAVLAQIYAWTGEQDQAFGLLDHLLATPNGLTVPMVKLDPAWDPLRKDPRYQALIDKYKANAMFLERI
jgi:tetratricopeptide (TPR) repeat protein